MDKEISQEDGRRSAPRTGLVSSILLSVAGILVTFALRACGEPHVVIIREDGRATNRGEAACMDQYFELMRSLLLEHGLSGSANKRAALLERFRTEGVTSVNDAAPYYQEAFRLSKRIDSEKVELMKDLVLLGEASEDSIMEFNRYLESVGAMEILDSLHEAAKRPCSVWSTEWDVDTKLPGLLGSRDCLSLLLYRAGISDAEESVRCVESALRLACSIGDGPLLIETFMATVLYHTIADALPSILEKNHSSALLARLQASLVPNLLRRHLARAFVGEMFSATHAMTSRMYVDEICDSEWAVHYVDLLRELCRQAQRPWHQSGESLMKILEEWNEKEPAFFDEIGSAAIHVSRYKRIAETESRLALTKLAVACKQFRNRNGKYSPKLDDLKTVLDRLPIDPCTGASFRMKQNDGTITLWGAGADKSDDGGTDDTKDVLIVLKK